MSEVAIRIDASGATYDDLWKSAEQSARNLGLWPHGERRIVCDAIEPAATIVTPEGGSQVVSWEARFWLTGVERSTWRNGAWPTVDS